MSVGCGSQALNASGFIQMPSGAPSGALRMRIWKPRSVIVPTTRLKGASFFESTLTFISRQPCVFVLSVSGNQKRSM